MSKMISTIYLHVGVHKTGTTSIQEYLGSIKDELNNIGYLYPYISVNNRINHNHSLAFYSMFCNQPEEYFQNKKLTTILKKTTDEINAEYYRELSSQIQQFKGSNLLISGEDISLLNIDELKNLRTFLIGICNPRVRIKVIFFIRHPLTLAPSMTLQILNLGSSIKESIQEVTKITKDFYRSRIEKFQQVFDPSQISVIRYEDALRHKQGILGCFFDWLDIKRCFIIQPSSKRFNKSLSFEGAILLEKINESTPLFINNNICPERNSLKISMLKSIPGIRFTYNHELNRKVWNDSRKDMQWLHSNFSLEPYEWYQLEKPDLKQIWSRRTLVQIIRTTHLQPQKIRKVIIRTLISEAKERQSQISYMKCLNLRLTAVFLQLESSILKLLFLVTGSEKRVRWVYGRIKGKLKLA